MNVEKGKAPTPRLEDEVSSHTKLLPLVTSLRTNIHSISTQIPQPHDWYLSPESGNNCDKEVVSQDLNMADKTAKYRTEIQQVSCVGGHIFQGSNARIQLQAVMEIGDSNW